MTSISWGIGDEPRWHAPWRLMGRGGPKVGFGDISSDKLGGENTRRSTSRSPVAGVKLPFVNLKNFQVKSLTTRSLPMLAALAVSIAGAGCTKIPDAKSLQNKVDKYWTSCSFVGVTDFKVVNASTNVVRYTYNLEVKKDGRNFVPSDCDKANVLTLEALANEDIDKLKSGTKIDVTQELRF